MQIKLLHISVLSSFFLACSGINGINKKNQSNRVRFVEDAASKKIDVLIDDDLFTSYIYPDNLAKPVLYPLITATGKRLTRGFPIDPQPGERVDHVHHVGYWLNYGDVNGYDFWNNSLQPRKGRNYGIIYHQETTNVDESKGTLEVTTRWVSDNQEHLLDEQTSFRFFVKDGIRQIDRFTTLTAKKEVSFKDNKEGMVAVRVIRALELPSDKPVLLLNENGEPNKEKMVNNNGVNGDYLSSKNITGSEVWGTRARWMHLHGQLDNEPVSLTLIDHPDNIGYPTYWHARGYGLFSANPLGQKVFSKGKEKLNFQLKKGESVNFKYRLLVHGGSKISKEKIEQSFENFSKQ